MFEKEKAMADEIEIELRTNPKYKTFFEQYSKSSIDFFIGSYKHMKAGWVTHGERYLKYEQDRILKFNEIAEHKLWEIQHVKLFNLQCLWRAEQITIPEIKISCDFEYWDNLIENCPFLPPISEDEFNLYREYILTEDADLSLEPCNGLIRSWQNYDEIKDSYENQDASGINFPGWYLFYYKHLGRNPYSFLPNIRGDKEEFYKNLYYDQPMEKVVSSQPQIQRDERPIFSYYGLKNLEDFMNKFEKQKVIQYAKAIEDNRKLNSDWKLDDALDTLKHANEKVSVASFDDDWRTAIIKTADSYIKKKVHTALEHVYDNYLHRLKLGIAFKYHQSESNIDFAKEESEFYQECILTGRKLNNEPEDFNF
ncbi:MAG: hypothetical protein WCS69_06435 [Ignavibacteriaceae bacterium]|jgi:hypothetical protein